LLQYFYNKRSFHPLLNPFSPLEKEKGRGFILILPFSKVEEEISGGGKNR